jgi:hypothetical protein
VPGVARKSHRGKRECTSLAFINCEKYEVVPHFAGMK